MFLDSFEQRLRYFLGDEENTTLDCHSQPEEKTKEPLAVGSADV
jgi:hypothetical protein